MSASAGFVFDSQNQKSKFQSRFGAKQNQNAPKRMLFQEISNRNETGYDDFQMRPQSRPPIQQQQIFHFPPKHETPCDPVEQMFPPDPPQKFQGFSFTPSNEICLDDDIELEPLLIREEVQWF